MFKIIIICLAIYVLYRLFKNDFLHRKQEDAAEERKERDEKIATGEMVKDPECGVYVSKDSGITVRDGETIHHFCSYECRDKFLNRLKEGGRQIPPLE
ncbi:MAG: transcriptional regulator [Desulfovibrionaceae bacterium]|nr:transcriptional regulator [Desulfovibrionaceae bacterium]